MVEQIASIDAAKTPHDVLAARLRVDSGVGLSPADAILRREITGGNVLESAPRRSLIRQWLAHMAEPMTYLLLAATVLSFTVWWIDGADGVPVDAIVILAIVFINALWGGAQHARATAAVDALRSLITPWARVLRDGVIERVPVADVVPGDVLVLRAGDAVPADARVIDAIDLLVNEAALTGESEPVAKRPEPLATDVVLGDRFCMVHRGTTVARGQGRAIVTAVGMDTELGRMARLMAATPSAPSPLQQEIARIGRMLGLAVVVIASALLAVSVWLWGLGDLQQIATTSMFVVAVAVAAVPEGLPTILTVILALGMQTMARRNAIITRLASVETLGSATVICADKTGTLTSGHMSVAALVTIAEGRMNPHNPAARDVLRAGALANSVLPEASGELDGLVGDPTDVAVIRAADRAGVLPECVHAWRVRSVRPFTRERRLMSVIATAETGPSERHLVVKGAPEDILDRCVRGRTRQGLTALTQELRSAMDDQIAALMDEGLRVIAVAERTLSSEQLHDGASERDLTFTGLLALGDPPRAGAADVIAAAGRAGIRTIMITGDHPRTAARIARDVGLGHPGAAIITGSQVDAMSDSDLVRAAATAVVFARVAPEHKLRIVTALQSDGDVVAMTGDGVNDAPALRAADIGVAMGRTGTDAARQSATLILGDDDIATMVDAIRHGRGIVDNIRTFLSYLVACNWGEVLTVAAGVVAVQLLLGTPSDGTTIVLPLLATQILWINLLTDAAPALALGMSPVSAHVMDRPPRGRRDPIMDRTIWRQIALIGPAMAVSAVGIFVLFARLTESADAMSLTHARTGTFTVLVLSHLAVAVMSVSRACRHRALILAVTSSVVLQVAVVHVPALNRAFGTTPLTATEWLMCGAAAVVPATVARWVRRQAV